MSSGQDNIRDVLYNSVLCQGNVALAVELHRPFAHLLWPANNTLTESPTLASWPPDFLFLLQKSVF